MTTVPPATTGPVPFCVNGPSRLTLLEARAVAVPELVMIKGPLLVVVTETPLMKLLPVTAIPDGPLVFRSPKRLVVPVPFDCVIEAAVISWTDALLVSVIVKAPMRVTAPIALFKLISPVPELRVIG